MNLSLLSHVYIVHEIASMTFCVSGEYNLLMPYVPISSHIYLYFIFYNCETICINE